MLVSGYEAIFQRPERLRVLSAVDYGTPREEVAKTFSVSMPTIKRWVKRRKETGDVEPRAIPGRPSRKGAMLRGWLPKHLEANDDLTLEEEHRQAFEEEFGQNVSTSTIGRAIADLPDGGWPLKKVAEIASERDEQKRGLWRWLASRLAARRLVFVDESGFHTSMRRLREPELREERGPLGEGPEEPWQEHYPDRLDHPGGSYGRVDECRGSHRRLLAFESYVEHFLAPSLCEGQVVVLDKLLGAHRTEIGSGNS